MKYPVNISCFLAPDRRLKHSKIQLRPKHFQRNEAHINTTGIVFFTLYGRHCLIYPINRKRHLLFLTIIYPIAASRILAPAIPISGNYIPYCCLQDIGTRHPYIRELYTLLLSPGYWHSPSLYQGIIYPIAVSRILALAIPISGNYIPYCCLQDIGTRHPYIRELYTLLLSPGYWHSPSLYQGIWRLQFWGNNISLIITFH